VNQTPNKELDYYIDENGLFVFTEKYHLEKGHCCGHGCRHCPYQFESVPEPKRTILLNEKKQPD
jgi:Family of unknown function (DUF5522)